MNHKLGIAGVMIFLFGVIFISTISFEEAWAQNSESYGDDLFEDPGSFFTPDGTGPKFLLFVIGVAIYSLFVWYFYRYISKRDLFPKFFYFVEKEAKISIAKKIGFAAIYVVSFPIIIFVWFVVLAFFVFLIAEDMPFFIAVFVSMAIIAVVRILTYYREDAAKEVAKMIPYAILSFLLTSAAVYANPHFFTEKDLGSIPTIFIEFIEEIAASVLIISIFEYSFRVGFLVKRKFLPVSDKKLEEDIETEVEGITKTHFKKLENKEKELSKKLEEDINELKKLKEEQKKLFDQLKGKHE